MKNFVRVSVPYLVGRVLLHGEPRRNHEATLQFLFPT